MIQRTVTLLLSDKRSGSTFLERSLCAAPEIRHVSYTPHTYNETHFWVKAAWLLDAPTRLFSGGSAPRAYGSRRQIRRSLSRFLEQNVPGFIPPTTDHALVFDGWEALCDKFARPIFFEKSPHHIHHWAALELMLQWAETTSFQVRFIGLVRHPLGVLHSARARFDSDPQKRQFAWGEAMRNLLNFEILAARYPRASYLRTHYETLVADPSELVRLFQFIGVPPTSTGIADAYFDSMNRWQADPAFDLLLDPGIERLARYFGYSIPSSDRVIPKSVHGWRRWQGASLAAIRRTRSRIYYRLNRSRS